MTTHRAHSPSQPRTRTFTITEIEANTKDQTVLRATPITESLMDYMMSLVAQFLLRGDVIAVDVRLANQEAEGYDVIRYVRSDHPDACGA